MNMHNIWAKRFAHYIQELQKYMQYIFTGHIAVVIVFVLGAIGYQYSEWLKTVDTSFPVAPLLGVLIGIVSAFSKPTTLLKEPDQVYLLPLESSMKNYFQKALTWTFFSQLLLPVVLYIAFIPLMRVATTLSIQQVWLGVALVIVMKWLNVKTEFGYRYVNRGQALALDRLVRFVLNGLAIFYFVQWEFIMTGIFLVFLAVYYTTIQRKVYADPVPYEHFVKIEQNRMYRFYRFANYFTDVPHLRGSVKRRKWLDVTMKWIPYRQENAQAYLVWRTFIRTDDLFFLWVRLTVISALFAAFIQVQFVTWIVSGAMVFALVIQLKQALQSKSEFRMDMLFPIKEGQREKAIRQLLIYLIVAQAVIVTLCNVMMPQLYVTPIVILLVGFITLKLSK